MIKFPLLPLLPAIVSLGLAHAWAQQAAPPPPLVTTLGSAEVSVVPDLADLSFEVEVRNADLALGRKLQGERAARVLAALRAAGVAEKELQTSQVQISPNYRDGNQDTNQTRFFTVQQSFACTLHDLKKVAEFTSAAVEAGATAVQPAVLRTSELRKHRDEARVLAIRAAKEKAAALAGELGVKVGRPYSIMEAGGSFGLGQANAYNNIQAARGPAEGETDRSQGQFAPGTIRVVATITVSFLLE